MKSASTAKSKIRSRPAFPKDLLTFSSFLFLAIISQVTKANAQQGIPQRPPVKEADYISVNEALPIVSFSSLTMKVTDRQVDLQVKVTAPVTGKKLPVLLFSHGLGYSNYISSIHGYNPLVEFYASHGFVVIQPTHMDSKTLNLPPNSPAVASSWRSRANDMHFLLDNLDEIEKKVPGLKGRIDHNSVVAVGHSAGGQTMQLLAGMQPTDPANGQKADLSDKRIKAVVMIGAPGGSKDLGQFLAEHFPIARDVDFSKMKTPALVIAGDKDINPAFSPRVSWRADAYPLSPGPKCLLTLFGATHSYGGVAQYDAAETTDENPERVSIIQRISWAYLWSNLYPDNLAWTKALSALEERHEAMGRIECK